MWFICFLSLAIADSLLHVLLFLTAVETTNLLQKTAVELYRWRLTRIYLHFLPRLFMISDHHHKHHHRHRHELWIVRPNVFSCRHFWSFHLFLGCPMFLLPIVWYCRACFGTLHLSIPCKCCIHFRWYCCIFRKMFCTPILSLTDWFLSPSNLAIPNKCPKIFIYVTSSLCSPIFFSTQGSTLNFKALVLEIGLPNESRLSIHLLFHSVLLQSLLLLNAYVYII